MMMMKVVDPRVALPMAPLAAQVDLLGKVVAYEGVGTLVHTCLEACEVEGGVVASCHAWPYSAAAAAAYSGGIGEVADWEGNEEGRGEEEGASGDPGPSYETLKKVASSEHAP